MAIRKKTKTGAPTPTKKKLTCPAPGCNVKRGSVAGMEKHIRKAHPGQ